MGACIGIGGFSGRLNVKHWLKGLKYDRVPFRKTGWWIAKTTDGPGLTIATGRGVSYLLWNRHGE